MKKHIAKIALLGLVVASLVAVPTVSVAQDQPKTDAPAAPAPAPKKHGLPFKGKVSAVDASAMTFTVGTMTINVTSTTKIAKDGKPGTFSDITAGETVTGAYKKDDAGKLNATTVRIGAKGPKKEKATDGSAPAAPAPAN